VQRFLDCCGPRAARFWIWLHTSTPADWLLVFVGSAGIWAALRTLTKINEQTTASTRAADAAMKMLSLSQHKERAYVSMTHYSPGLVVDAFIGSSSEDAEPGDKRNVAVKVKIQNDGNTPATITAHLLQLLFTDQPLPHDPPYQSDSVKVIRMPLVQGGHFDFQGFWQILESARQRVHTEEAFNLYVLGYVDYIDRFGGHHRSGYGRVWDPFANIRNVMYEHTPGGITHVNSDEIKDNLPYVTAMAYNYDRERVPGEGNDWE
jgi:hypothetical protein